MAAVPLAEAARTLGVSVDTVRRRIRAGTLTAHQDTRGHYRVTLPPADAAPLPRQAQADAAGRLGTPTQDAADLTRELASVRALLAEVQHQRDALEQQLAARTKAEEELRVLLLNTQRLLTGPAQEPATAAESAENGPLAAAPAQTAPCRRWAFWRR